MNCRNRVTARQATATRHLRIALRLVVIAALAVAGMVFSADLATADSAASSGYGAMTVSPTSATVGTSTQLTFSYSFTDNGHFLPTGSSVTVAVPASWTAPTATNTSVAAPTANCNTSAALSFNATTVTIPLANGCRAPAGNSTATLLTLTYTGTPSAAGTTTFTTSSGAGGAPVAISSQPTVTVNPAAASQLVFTTAPSTTNTAGTAFAQQPVVKVEDASGNVVTSSSASVTIAALNNGSAGPAMTCGTGGGPTVTAVSGVATFSGCFMTIAGSYTMKATSGTLSSATNPAFTVANAAASKLAFVKGPSDAFVGTAMSPAVTIQVQDQYNNPVSGISVTLTPSSNVTFGTGLAATTDSSGLATFGNLTATHTAIAATVTGSATVSGTNLSTGTSTTFNVSVKVTTSANALGDSAADAGGSGVASVSYYYCTGFAATCAAAGRTLIGTSTTAGTFALAWTGQPANGAYTVIAVATDNVGNVSSGSAGTPVSVSN